MKNKGVSGSMEMKAFIFDMDGLIFDSERVVQLLEYCRVRDGIWKYRRTYL